MEKRFGDFEHIDFEQQAEVYAEKVAFAGALSRAMMRVRPLTFDPRVTHEDLLPSITIMTLSILEGKNAREAMKSTSPGFIDDLKRSGDPDILNELEGFEEEDLQDFLEALNDYLVEDSLQERQVLGFADIADRYAEEHGISRAEVVSDESMFRGVRREYFVSPMNHFQELSVPGLDVVEKLSDPDRMLRALFEGKIREERPYADDFTVQEEVSYAMETIEDDKEISAVLKAQAGPEVRSQYGAHVLSLIHREVMELWPGELTLDYWRMYQSAGLEYGMRVHIPVSLYARKEKIADDDKKEVSEKTARRIAAAVRLGLSENPDDWSVTDKLNIGDELSA